MDQVLVNSGELREFCKAVLLRVGVSESDAEVVADALVMANLRGVDSHGVVRLHSYVERILRGLIDPKAKPQVVRDFGATCLIDGNNGLGYVAAMHAVNAAVEKARKYGVGVVGVRNSSHFGMAAYYGIKIAESGMVGIVLANAAPAMAPWGGKTARLGTNPVCITFPFKDGAHVTLDMALSVVARGKIRLAALKKERIPEGWALDEEGRPTTDPEAAIRGTLAPIGGPKGYGLAVAVDILSGILTGSAYSIYVKALDDYSGPSRTGFFIEAINVEAFRPYDEYLKDMQDFEKIIKETPKASGVSEIYLPGEIEINLMRKRLKEGVPLDHETLNLLKKTAMRLGVELPNFLA
ncbi:MAG: Ldh family oxidoreductase [Zestosphaera sp.]